MKTRKTLLIVVLLCIALAIGTTALATDASFSETIPSFGHKTLATGIKSNGNDDRWSIEISENSEETRVFEVWIDANGRQCATNIKVHAGYVSDPTDKERYNVFIPGLNNNMALRTQPIDDNISGGKRVIGKVNFDASTDD